jgi:hypothetical protein
MATNFPTSLDSLTNPTSGDALNSPSHAGQHADANDAIEALQAKVGVNSSAVNTSIDYWINNTGVTLTGAQTLTNKTINGAILDQSEENWNIVASAATGTINFDVKTASIWYYTSNASANHTVNVRGDSSTTLSSLLAVGDSITVVWANTNGTTAYWPSTFQVDGSTITPKWQGGTAPTGGNASAIDLYSYTIVKTAATPTYTVFASQTQFK